jgi:general secretion pathway protein E
MSDLAPAELSASSAQLLLDGLLENGLIAREPAEKALVLERQSGMHPVSALLRLNAIAELPLYRFYAAQLGLPLLSHEQEDAHALAEGLQQTAAALGFSLGWMELKGLIIVRDGPAWRAAFREQLHSDVLHLLKRKILMREESLSLAVMTATLSDQIFRAQRAATQVSGASDDLRALRELAEEGPTIELVNSILSESVTRRASDLHFEPDEFEFAVRLRIDGEMVDLARHARDRFDAVACRLKILSNLDIAERRLPQDGRINARVNGESFDIRVSVLPGSLGESIVLRLLRQERKPAHLGDLGMGARHAKTFEYWTQLANGIVLVTGPTGSGKSTTLYTALELANDRSRKIITVEDPVEYRIKGITQLQVNGDIGFTFAAALRSILRHDPDMILVGEIRDEETSRIAIQSALTGHMVLSTLHTNSAIGAITRLVDMGLEPFLIAASVRGLMAQRLVRRLCEHCAVADDAIDPALHALLERFDLGNGSAVRKPVGCLHCSGTGYFGRGAIYDLIEVSNDLGHLIATGASESQLLQALGPHAGQGLLHSGVEMVALGRTTLSEVIRATAGA